MNNTFQKKTYTGLDVGKFLCAFLILFYHYFSEHGGLPGILDEALSLYAVAVALFMVISGFLLFNKLDGIATTEQRWLVVKKQVKRIYTIYLLWSIPYVAYTISRWDWTSISWHFVFWQVQGWIFKSTFYTIWFMPMLAIGTVVAFWATEKFSTKSVTVLAASCYFVGSLQSTYKFVGMRIPVFDGFMQFSDLWLGGARGWLFFAFPLLLVGKAMVKKQQEMRPAKMAVLSCDSVLCLFVEALAIRFLAKAHTGIDLTIMMIPTTFCILGFLISVSLVDGNYAKWMRSMSTLIFMSQRLVLTVFPALCPVLFERYIFRDYYFGAFWVCVVTLSFSGLIISLSRKHRCFMFLY